MKRLTASNKGQAMVESAIIIPLMVAVMLSTLQLIMIQHARLMTEYAAFNAARAGIVWNADRFIMENAAILSLLPTMEGLLSESDIGNPMQMLAHIAERAMFYQVNRRVGQAVDFVVNGTNSLISHLPSQIQGPASAFRDTVVNKAATAIDSALRDAVDSIFGDEGLVSVEIINPTMATFPTGIGHKEELDFDSVREGNAWRRATRLSIKVKYYYVLRIPFGNRIVHTAYLATRTGTELYGALWNPQMQKGETGFRRVAPVNISSGIREVRRLWKAAQGKKPVFMVPLTATYTMRMQSNPYRRSLEI